jgi:hypothetical protein
VSTRHLTLLRAKYFETPIVFLLSRGQTGVIRGT